TLLPGLIDCHTHLVLRGHAGGSIPPSEPTAETALAAAASARRTLQAGFTTVRDLGGRYGVEFLLRRAIDENALPGPRLLLAGRIISITCDVSLGLPGMFREADSLDELRLAVR